MTDSDLTSQKYIHDIALFAEKYMNALSVLALTPTVDRSLLYHLHIQQYSLSCEIAALAIILERLGISVTEQDILSHIPQFPSIYASWGIWWDPDIEFVGYYTGGQTKQTGYGVYEFPLAQYAQRYQLHTEIANVHSGGLSPEEHMKTLLASLDNQNIHVLLWWDYCTDPMSEDGILNTGGRVIARFFPIPARNHCLRSSRDRQMNWKTPAGNDILWLSGEHAFVLLGYVGAKNKPTHIIVWDTYTGRHVYPYDEWMQKWSLLGYRSLIISQ
jgi:uncharacterized protein YvpB